MDIDGGDCVVLNNLFYHTVPLYMFWDPHSGFIGGVICALIVSGAISAAFYLIQR